MARREGRTQCCKQQDVSGADRSIDSALIPPQQAGNLAAMASTIPRMQLIPGLDGNPAQVVNPLPVGNEWVLLPDGAIAIVRGQDYRIDWLAPDGKIMSSPKMPVRLEAHYAGRKAGDA